MCGQVTDGSLNHHRLLKDMSGFQDTGPMATGILAIGQYFGPPVEVWYGFLVIGKVVYGIQATGEGDTPMGISGYLDIAIVLVFGILAIGEDLKDHH
jgi:hypothetical protein